MKLSRLCQILKSVDEAKPIQITKEERDYVCDTESVSILDKREYADLGKYFKNHEVILEKLSSLETCKEELQAIEAKCSNFIRWAILFYNEGPEGIKRTELEINSKRLALRDLAEEVKKYKHHEDTYYLPNLPSHVQKNITLVNKNVEKYRALGEYFVLPLGEKSELLHELKKLGDTKEITWEQYAPKRKLINRKIEDTQLQPIASTGDDILSLPNLLLRYYALGDHSSSQELREQGITIESIGRKEYDAPARDFYLEVYGGSYPIEHDSGSHSGSFGSGFHSSGGDYSSSSDNSSSYEGSSSSDSSFSGGSDSSGGGGSSD